MLSLYRRCRVDGARAGCDIGKKAILEFWSGSSRTSALIMHKCTAEKIVFADDEAHDYGYFFTQSQKPGEPAAPVASAKYYIIWTKDKQGNWKMKMDMWNSRSSAWNK